MRKFLPSLLGLLFASAAFAQATNPVPTGPAGTPNKNVITVQGIAGGSALPLGCVYNISPPTLASGQVGFVQCDSTGHLAVSGGGGGGGGAVTIADGADVAQGTTTDPAYSGSGASTEIALLKWVGANINAVTNAINTTALVQPIQIRAQSIAVIDHASSTVTITGNDAAIPLDSGSTYAATVNVTAVSGTNPTADFVLQESFDSGATFKDIWWCQRLKAAGVCQVPEQLMTGQRRWRWNITGTSPSFTFSIAGMRGTGTAPIQRQFFDYNTLNPNGTGTPSPTWDVLGCKAGYVFISVSAQTTGVTIQGAMSPDATLFGTFGNTAASSTTSGLVAATFSNPPLQYVHNQVTTAGSGVTMNFNGLACSG